MENLESFLLYKSNIAFSQFFLYPLCFICRDPATSDSNSVTRQVSRWNMPVNSCYLSSVNKSLVFVKNNPERLLKKLPFSAIFRPFWGLFIASVTHIGFKRGFHIAKWVGKWWSTKVIFSLVKKPLVLVKKYPQRKQKLFFGSNKEEKNYTELFANI